MTLFHRSRGKYGKTGGGTQQRHTTLASATLFSRKQITSRITSKKAKTWQQEAWAFYDTIGELRFASRWLGNALSRAHLFIGKPQPEGGGDPEPAETPPDIAIAALEDLHYGQVGQGEMLRRLALHLSIVGESFIVGIDPRPEDGPDVGRRWVVASTDEFANHGGKPRLKLPESGESIELDPEKCTIIRLWNPHPREAWESDSSIRANLPVLREISALSQWITATVDSRLAGAGIFTVPHSATMPNPAQSDSDGVEPMHEDPFVDGLMQAVIPPITDRDHPSAVVPTIIKVPDEAIGKLQHITFATELSTSVVEMREAAIRRFAGGSDLPGEILLGTSDQSASTISIGSESGAGLQQIEDQAVKLSVEPLLGVIADALTQQYLWPAMRAAGHRNPEDWVIWYDTSELTQPPDRSAEAQALFDKGALSSEALLRENGFGVDDVPTDDEKRSEFARQVVLAKPELLPALARFVGFDGMEDQLQQAIQPTSPAVGEQPEQSTLPPGGARPQPPGQREIGGGPRQQQPAITADAGDTWVIKAVEGIALRALELAGKRLINGGPRGVKGKPEAAQVHSWDLHTIAPTPTSTDVERLLNGAFDLMSATIGDSPCIQDAVDTYCRALLSSGRPHRREYLANTLVASGCITQN